MNDSELRDHMIEWAHRYNVRSFIENDPVQFVHKFKDTRDIEVAGLLVSWISWGNRKAIINKGKEIMDMLRRVAHEHGVTVVVACTDYALGKVADVAIPISDAARGQMAAAGEVVMNA